MTRSALFAFALAAAVSACGGPLAGETETPADEATQAASTSGCAGAWEDAQSYAGLVGVYTQPLPYVGDMTRLQVLSAVDTDPVRTGGQHTRTVRGLARSGRYEALEQNPAIGAVLSFWELGRSEPDMYFVTGVRRSLGRVTALCLIGSTPGARPFALRRAL